MMRNHPVSCWDNNQLICTQPEALSQLLCCSTQGRFCYCLQTLLCAFSARHNQLVSTTVLSTRQYITLQLVRKKLILIDRLFCPATRSVGRRSNRTTFKTRYSCSIIIPSWVSMESIIVFQI